jgi:D-alanyl-D-alanine carboxypeptidase/D-alanyl-D-alanine-endopeptidase (penicillin-binding protein 4)
LPGKNHFIATLAGDEPVIKQSVPFDPMGLDAAMMTLRNISYRSVYRRGLKDSDLKQLKPLYSQATDSVIRQMLLRSDNFFAEQLLLQSADKTTGKFSERLLIDSLVKKDLADLPDKPHWVDGSGLSRYNLFTPRSQTYLLKKMIDSFGVDYVKHILAHNGEGTLKTFLSDYPPVIYAKTGTLSNNFCLSGFLITKSKKRLLFSVMINHSMAKPSYMRACVERYLKEVIEKM